MSSTDGVADLSHARRLLHALGYSSAHLSERVDWPGNRLHGIIAYARPDGPHDAATATITVTTLPHTGTTLASTSRRLLDTIANEAEQLSVPAAIIVDHDSWALYAVDPGPELRSIDKMRWTDDFSAYRSGLSPAALMQAKLGERQLALFPAAAQVQKRGRSRREEFLGPRVRNAINLATAALVNGYGESVVDEVDVGTHNRAARLVIGALTVAVASDKEVSRRGPLKANADVRVNRAISAHPKQFGWLGAAPVDEREIMEILVADFEDIDFRDTEPQLLSELYEDILADDAANRANIGAHYTPAALARRVFASLPVEEIAPDDRRIYDPTCGSGSLLVAGHDRLRELQDTELDLRHSHSDLVMRITGGDSDPVAAGIANLALFLNALPAGNGWKIKVEDALDAEHPIPPTISVANPPWHYLGKERDGEIAHPIVEKLVHSTAPGGLVGLILPAGWLSRTTARDNRNFVFGHLDVFDVWRLPASVFSGAGMASCVILGRKKPATHPRNDSVWNYRRITSARNLTTFYRTGASHSMLAWNANPAELELGALHSHYHGQRRSTPDNRVATLAEIVTGPQPESKAKLIERGGPAASNCRLVSWRSVHPYADVSEATSTPINFPHDMQKESSRGAAMLGSEKVLVSAGKNPEYPWRLKVAIDTQGNYITKNTAVAIIPRELQELDKEQTARLGTLNRSQKLFAIFAYMSSGFVSAWLDEEAATRNIKTSAIGAIPMPDSSTLIELARLGSILRDAKDKRSVLKQIDDHVWRWSGITGQLLYQICERLNEGEAPEGGYRYDLVDNGELTSNDADIVRIRRPGVVRSVSPVDGVVLEVDTETRWESSLPAAFPGGLLREGASFMVDVVADGGADSMESGVFHFDEFAYLTDGEVIEAIEQIINRPRLADGVDL